MLNKASEVIFFIISILFLLYKKAFPLLLEGKPDHPRQWWLCPKSQILVLIIKELKEYVKEKYPREWHKLDRKILFKIPISSKLQEIQLILTPNINGNITFRRLTWPFKRSDHPHIAQIYCDRKRSFLCEERWFILIFIYDWEKEKIA